MRMCFEDLFEMLSSKSTVIVTEMHSLILLVARETAGPCGGALSKLRIDSSSLSALLQEGSAGKLLNGGKEECRMEKILELRLGVEREGGKVRHMQIREVKRGQRIESTRIERMAKGEGKRK